MWVYSVDQLIFPLSVPLSRFQIGLSAPSECAEHYFQAQVKTSINTNVIRQEITVLLWNSFCEFTMCYFLVCCQATAAIQGVFMNLSEMPVCCSIHRAHGEEEEEEGRQGSLETRCDFNTKCNLILMTFQHMKNSMQNSMRTKCDTLTILLRWIASHKAAAADATQWVVFTCDHLAEPFMQSDLQVRYNASKGKQITLTDTLQLRMTKLKWREDFERECIWSCEVS